MEYILVDKIPVVEPDMTKWAQWFGSADRSVRKSSGKGSLVGQPLEEFKVSTVFLGMDHSFSEGPPLLFETMVFGGLLDGEQDRCSTWEEAEAMHQKMCKRVEDAYRE